MGGFNRRAPKYVKKGYFTKALSSHKSSLNVYKAKVIKPVKNSEQVEGKKDKGKNEFGGVEF